MSDSIVTQPTVRWPPFESVEACPKCGHARWRLGMAMDDSFFALHYVAPLTNPPDIIDSPEHFEVSCRACDYTWREATRTSP